METSKPFRVLLYYKYVPIENPEQFAADHLAFCKSLNLLGRIVVAGEGINGTLSGTWDETEAYIQAMRADERFADMVFKIDEVEGHAFSKMHVRPKKEIVTFRLEHDVNPNELTGKYLEPEEFHKALQEDDVVIVDARTDYEYDLGHFRNAIRPDGVESFREFPDWVRNTLAQYKDKKILAYCTGGIRCEKFTGFLLQEGFKDVYHLHGGIVSYGKDPHVQGQLWDGKCYVFDKRIAVPINRVEPVVVSKCYHCGTPTDRYVNCANHACHNMHFSCEECERKTKRSCSTECENAPRRERIPEFETAA